MADLEGSKTLEIEAPIDRCFAIAADVANAPRWQGVMASAKVLEEDGHGRPSLVESDIDVSVRKVTVQLRFRYDEPDGMQWTRESGDLRSLDGSWRFVALDDDRTEAKYALDIGLGRGLSMFAKTVRGPARSKVRELLADRAVEGLKREAERP
ncbi:MAG: type II toxin-antitoxin system RatA family toxin [Solirubrobacterales bacterium]